MTDPRYGHQTFSRDSSEYSQHSIISPKRIGQVQLKLERKARPYPQNPVFGVGSGGTSTDLREVCARRKSKFTHFGMYIITCKVLAHFD